jgi:hydrogenase nickel incorporation protein HypA/HybF
MHETMIAQGIVDAISKEAQKHNATPLSAKISCGQLNPINDEVLNFAFEIAAKGSVCEGISLEIVHIPLKATCKSCGECIEFDIYSPGCSACQSADIKIEPDAPLLLEEIEFED